MPIAPLLTGCSLALFGTSALAAPDVQLTRLLDEASTVAGVGMVEEIYSFAINDHASWMAVVGTDHPDESADQVLLHDGQVILREGDVPAFASGPIVAIESPGIDRHGNQVVRISTDEPLVEVGWLLLNGEPILRTDAPPELAGFSSSSVLHPAFELELDDVGRILARISVSDPEIELNFVRALISFELDAGGSAGPATVIVRDTDFVPGQSLPVYEVQLGSDAGGDGLVVYGLRFLPPQARVYAALYENEDVVAQTGEPEPITGGTWDGFGSWSMNAHGSLALAGALEADPPTDEVLLLAGELFVRTGDVVDAVAPHAITSLTHGPVTLTDAGDVVWYGEWEDGSTQAGLFRNEELWIHAGVTQVDGLTITEVQQPPTTFDGPRQDLSVSDDGRFALARVLTGPRDVLVLISPLGAIEVSASCTANEGVLSSTTAAPAIGDPMNLTLDQAQSAAALATLFISTKALPGYPPCGLELPGLGELVIDVLPPNPVLTVSEVASGEPVTFHFGLPDLVALVGLRFWAQGLFQDPLNFVEPMRLTNAVTIDVGHAP